MLTPSAFSERLLQQAPSPLRGLHALWSQAHPLLLDSAATGSTGASYLMCRPRRQLISRGGVGQLLDEGGEVRAQGPFFRLLKDLLRELQVSPGGDGQGFRGGLAGYIGYEVGRQVEIVPAPQRSEQTVPEAWLGLYDQVLAYSPDGTCRWWSCSLPGAPSGPPLPELIQAPPRGHIEHPGPAPWAPHPVEGWPGISSSLQRQQYKDRVAELVRRIHAGDLFQANLTQRLAFEIEGEALQAYGRLRDRACPTYGAAMRLESASILSASPECFLEVRHSDRGLEVSTEPIKGTRPRGRTPEEDQELAQALLKSRKDRAENLMIVDLLRNDLSRVAQPHSVTVPELIALRRFETVHHLASTVCATLRQDASTADLLEACFPGGSISGAPKVQAMREIQRLEPIARGPYCGAVGWIGLDGAARLSVAIRTAVVRGGWATLGAGGGIVADSDPDQEYVESLHKAHALIEALAGRSLPRPVADSGRELPA